jgi:predicted O-methyltransferase YrrM
MIDKFVNWQYKDFTKQNDSNWLDDPYLKNIWDGTTGPSNSPDPVECFVLYNLAKNTQGNCLEIGSWKGRSSCFISKGISDSLPATNNRKLYCIDWFMGDNTGGAYPNKNEMIQSLTNFNLLSLVEIIDEDMLKIDYARFANIDLVFYDSDHSTIATVLTLSKIHSVLNSDAYVVMHDASWDSTKDAISQLSQYYHHLITLPVWEGLAILRKK